MLLRRLILIILITALAVGILSYLIVLSPRGVIEPVSATPLEELEELIAYHRKVVHELPEIPENYGKVILYGFSNNPLIVKALNFTGFKVVERGIGKNIDVTLRAGINLRFLSDVDEAVAIIINAHKLFIEKTLNEEEIKLAVRKALLQGKPVAFVSEEGVDYRSLRIFLTEILKDKPDALKILLNVIEDGVTYEVQYDASGNIISNRTLQDICLVEILQLIIYEGEVVGPSTGGLCASVPANSSIPEVLNRIVKPVEIYASLAADLEASVRLYFEMMNYD